MVDLLSSGWHPRSRAVNGVLESRETGSLWEMRASSRPMSVSLGRGAHHLMEVRSASSGTRLDSQVDLAVAWRTPNGSPVSNWRECRSAIAMSPPSRRRRTVAGQHEPRPYSADHRHPARASCMSQIHAGRTGAPAGEVGYMHDRRLGGRAVANPWDGKSRTAAPSYRGACIAHQAPPMDGSLRVLPGPARSRLRSHS